MEEIIEQYGAGLLQMLGGVGMLALFAACMQPGGVLQTIVLQYMNGICG